MHIKSKHEGFRYDCEQCDYQSIYKKNLKEHIETKHDGINRYACKECDYQSSRQDSLKKHIETKHFDFS